MNTEEKAKAYDEALERAKDCLTDRKFCETEDTIRSVMEYIFPQLAESENGRIREAIESIIRMYGKTRGEWIAGYDMDTLVVHLRDAFAYLEKQKEQKPVKSDTEKEYVRILKSIVSDFIRDKKPKDTLLYQDIFDWLDGRHIEQKSQNITLSREDCLHQLFENGTITMADYLYLTTNRREQKPVEKQDYSGLNDLERAIHRGFLSAGVENVPVTIIKETAKECLAQMKPVEWDDYTKTNLDRAIQIIKKAKGKLQGYQTDDGIYECDKAIEALEHFLYRGLEIEKPAEWNEEDREIAQNIMIFLKEPATAELCPQLRKECQDWLKSLPERFNLEQKEVWSDKDEKMLNSIINVVCGVGIQSNGGLREKQVSWLKSLPERFNLQPKEEWSEEKKQTTKNTHPEEYPSSPAECISPREYGLFKQLQQECIETIEQELYSLGKEHEKDDDSRIKFLKSLRPSWKPSEDEERLINTSISFLKDFADKGYENAVECIDWLKSKLNGNSCK